MQRLLKLIKSDLIRAYPNSCIARKLAGIFTNPSLQACILIRLSQCSPPYTYWIFRRILISLHSIDVGRGITIGTGLSLPHPVSIVLGQGVKIGCNCSIYQGVTIGQANGKYPTIGNGVCLYPNSIIVGETTIQDNENIRAGSFVYKPKIRNSTEK